MSIPYTTIYIQFVIRVCILYVSEIGPRLQYGGDNYITSSFVHHNSSFHIQDCKARVQNQLRTSHYVWIGMTTEIDQNCPPSEDGSQIAQGHIRATVPVRDGVLEETFLSTVLPGSASTISHFPHVRGRKLTARYRRELPQHCDWLWPHDWVWFRSGFRVWQTFLETSLASLDWRERR
jgi:hypothetical protein